VTPVGEEVDAHFCGSQSELVASATLAYQQAAAISFFAREQGDPFHFGSGDDCIGHPELWSSSDAVGAAVRVRVGKSVEIDGMVRHEQYRLNHLERAGGDVTVDHLSALSGSLTLSVVDR
jgi:hypothetical protein